MADVPDPDVQPDLGPALGEHHRLGLGDISLEPRDRGGDLGQDPGRVLGLDQETGLERPGEGRVPGHLDQPLTVQDLLGHERATERMDAQPLPRRDVPDDGLTLDRRAALRQLDHLSIDVLDPDPRSRARSELGRRFPEQARPARRDPAGGEDGCDEFGVDDDLAEPRLPVKLLHGRGFRAEGGGQLPGEVLLPPEFGGEDVLGDLPFPELPSQGDARRPALEVEPALELLARAGGRGRGEQAPRRRPLVRRQDLHDVPRLENGLERRRGAVDPGPGRVEPDLRVDLEGEVEGRGAGREVDDFSLGSEDVDLLRDEVCFQIAQELPRVLLLLEEGGHFAEPVEPTVLFHRAGRRIVLVQPMGGDAVLGEIVHLPGPDLDLEHLPSLGDERRVQGLVEIGLGHGDEIAEPLGQVGPALVDDAEEGVAVLDGVGDDPQGQEVEDLVEGDVPPLHLAPDAVGALDPGEDLGRDAVFPDELLERPLHGLEVRLGRLSPGLHGRGDLGELPGGHVAKGQVLELGPDAPHAQPVGDRGVDVERLAGDLSLPLLVEVTEGLEVVDPVGQLDEDDPDIVGHGQDDLPDGLGPADFGRHLLDPADLGHALDQGGDLLAEILADVRGCRVRVLEDVVEEGGDERRLVEPHVGEVVGHFERMAEIGFPGTADLPFVGLAGEYVGLLEDEGLFFADVGGGLFEDVVKPDHGRTASLVRGSRRANA